MTERKKVLVAGATGVVGLAAMKHFASQGVETIAISRRTPRETYGAAHVSLDLMDADACAAFARQHGDVTHLVYAALFEKPGLIAGWREADQIDTNDAMLRNLIQPLMESAKSLRHVSILQGTKAYGAHIRPIETPAREDRSEVEHENFYWKQEAYLREAATGADWSWSIFRPQIIFGEATGAAMNLIPAIGAYGALLKERSEPLHFPGGAHTVLEAADADLVARAISWAGESEAAQNQIFNVTNGDVFTWRGVWPAIAAALGMEVGEERPMQAGAWLESQSEAWAALAEKHGLTEPNLKALLGESHHYIDFTMASGLEGQLPPAIVSTIKLRQSGLTEVIDTEAMFAKWFAWFQEAGYLPKP
ncbi:SDR family oxidoreductase [Henriciella marina]|uniref:SDR family oxidoreductase n=1 Tax=Henriciella marina TaxID=453851 RepID=A0ABT4LRS5_9PROT|nr:SDR family oxidoreductase [Henriciella marina]MCZ4297067.1 SDR family oxidoreductase [Henriciella marina]